MNGNGPVSSGLPLLWLFGLGLLLWLLGPLVLFWLFYLERRRRQPGRPLRRPRRMQRPEIQRPEERQREERTIDAINLLITSSQPRHAVITALQNHGCHNLSWGLDVSTYLKNPIAGGGFGDVFRGELSSRTSVAIKTLRVYESHVTPGGYQKRAARELYIWSKCKHRNVVKLMGLVEVNDSLAMVSRWEENGNLTHYLSRYPLTDRCHLITGICAGVSYLHENGIVHGDIKGSNVLVAQDGTPMLMDFGTAHFRDGDLRFEENEQGPGPSPEMAVNQERQHIVNNTDAFLSKCTTTDCSSDLTTPALGFTQTKTGLNFSLRWAAPELIMCGDETTTASDTYALGMTILETLTSTIPFAGISEQVLPIRIAVDKKIPTRPEKEIPERSVCGNKLWGLLTRCWSYNPNDRPSSNLVWDEIKSITAETLKIKEVETEGEGQE